MHFVLSRTERVKAVLLPSERFQAGLGGCARDPAHRNLSVSSEEALFAAMDYSDSLRPSHHLPEGSH